MREYLDHVEIKEDNQKKEQKYVRRADKIPESVHEKTFFLDEEIKPLKDNPSPGNSIH